MNDQEFDLLLVDIADRPPAADYETDFTPWRRAMNRVLWGWGLVTVTLNFWNLDLFLPGLGHLLMVLGFRSLRLENGWFHWAYRIALARVLWWLCAFLANASIFRSLENIQPLLLMGSYIFSCWRTRDNANCALPKSASSPLTNGSTGPSSTTSCGWRTGPFRAPGPCTSSQRTIWTAGPWKGNFTGGSSTTAQRAP